jgi:hypothetical protein
MTSFLHCFALLALGAVPHGIARRAVRALGFGEADGGELLETRVGVKEDGHQTVHNWRSMLPSRNGSFCQSLVDVQRLVPKSVTFVFFVFFSFISLSTPSNAILGTISRLSH